MAKHITYYLDMDMAKCFAYYFDMAKCFTYYFDMAKCFTYYLDMLKCFTCTKWLKVFNTILIKPNILHTILNWPNILHTIPIWWPVPRVWREVQAAIACNKKYVLKNVFLIVISINIFKHHFVSIVATGLFGLSRTNTLDQD